MSEPSCVTLSGAPKQGVEAHSNYSTVFTNAKAGMENVNKEKVKKVVYEISKDSAHFQNEQRKQEKVQQRIEKMKAIQQSLTPADLARRDKELEPQVAALDAKRELDQIWMHVDMDAFYASCEERDNPELASVPVAIGGVGMISTANYEARKYGVRAAMPGFIALKLCPHLKFVDLNFPKYEAAAAAARTVFARFDPNYSSRGLDEASLCVTEYCNESGCTPSQVAERVRAEVKEETRLTCSVGIAPNTMLAKIGSDINKPNGQFEVPCTRQAIMDFIQDLSVRKVPGIGRVSEQLLSAFGVTTVGGLQQKRAMVSYLFSPISFDYFLHVSLGLGSTKHFAQEDEERKSCSCERTFNPTSSKQEMEAKIQSMAERLHKELTELKLTGRCISLKLKQADFRTRQRSVTLPSFINSVEGIAAAGRRLLQAELPIKIRLLGLRVSSLQTASRTQCGSLDTYVRTHVKPKADSNASLGGVTEPAGTENSHEPVACEEQRRIHRPAGTAVLQNCPNGPAAPHLPEGTIPKPGFELCKECGAHIAFESMQEHLDMHLAQRLSATVNGAGYIESNPAQRRVGTIDKEHRTPARAELKRTPPWAVSKKSKMPRACTTSGALDRLLKR